MGHVSRCGHPRSIRNKGEYKKRFPPNLAFCTSSDADDKEEATLWLNLDFCVMVVSFQRSAGSLWSWFRPWTRPSRLSNSRSFYCNDLVCCSYYFWFKCAHFHNEGCYVYCLVWLESTRGRWDYWQGADRGWLPGSIAKDLRTWISESAGLSKELEQRITETAIAAEG